MTDNQAKKKNHVKQFALDIIKVLFALLILSTLFHSEISQLIDSVSDFAFHHFFFTSFIALLLLVITIEYEFFNGDHWLTFKEFIQRFLTINKKQTNQIK